MKFKELKAMSEPDLKNRLVELRKEHMKNCAQRALGASIKNPGKLKQVRKAIAKITMLLNKQEVTETDVTKIKREARQQG